jgi:predicted MFS family arabinose efflux permease
VDQQESKAPESKKGRLTHLFSYGAFHFIDDGFSDSIYLLLPFIALELGLSYSQVGLLKGVASAAMSLFQVPAGLLAERLGELTVVAAGTLGLIGGFILVSRAYSFPLILLALLGAKATGAGQHSLGASVLSRVFEASGRRAAIGTYNFSGDLGKVCLPFALTVMINWWGWRRAVFTLSLVAIAVLVILWTLARKNTPPGVRSVPREKLHLDRKSWGIQNIRSFSALLTIGIIDSSTRTAFYTFLPFLLIQKGITTSQVGFALTLLFAGGAAGKLACGFLAEWLGIIPMVWGTEILTCAAILSFLWAPTSVTWTLLPVAGFMLNGTSSVLYATVAEIISSTARSRGYGLYYAITLGSGAVAPLVFGLITDGFGLDVTMIAVASIVLTTLPLSRFLSQPAVS